MLRLSESWLTALQPVLDVLAEMIAYDGTVRMSNSYSTDVNEMMRELQAQAGPGGIPSVGLD
jgi:mitochondrial import receptor subunit TOM20